MHERPPNAAGYVAHRLLDPHHSGINLGRALRPDLLIFLTALSLELVADREKK